MPQMNSERTCIVPISGLLERPLRGLSWSWEIGQGAKVYSSSDRGIRDDDETAVYV